MASPSDHRPAGNYQLIGAEASYYTGKVRGYLRYKGIPFTEHLATRDMYENMILPKTGKRMIPVLVTPDGEALQDTSRIIDALEEKHAGHPVYPDTELQRLISLLLEIFGDEWLLIPAMHYRWTYCQDFAAEEFGKAAAPHETPEKQKVMGTKTAEYFARAATTIGISPETADGIEGAYLHFLKALDTHFAEHKFLLGDRPTIGDFGFFGPLYAHLYRDPYPGQIMQEYAPNVVSWVESMRDGDFESGALLANDAVPQTLAPILAMMATDHLPVVQDTQARFEQWVTEHQDQNLPRSIGVHRFTFGTAVGERSVFPYLLWMWQRASDAYVGMSPEGRSRTDEALGPEFTDMLMAKPIWRLEYKGYELAVLPLP